MSRKARQKLWWSVHWWLGLWAGSVFVLSGLTGSALVFYQAIDEWLNPERRTVVVSGPYRSFDDMVAAARAARPDLPGPYGLFLPGDRTGVVEAWFKAPVGETGHIQDIEVTIDPYRAEVLSRDRIWGQTVVSFIYELHKAWLLDEVGEAVVGCAGLLLVLSIGSGLYLWWPKAGRYRQAITFNPRGTRSRRYYDAHKLTGVAGSLMLLVLAGTGVYLEFPNYIVPLVKAVLPVPVEIERHSTVTLGTRPIPVDRAVAIARRRSKWATHFRSVCASPKKSVAPAATASSGWINIAGRCCTCRIGGSSRLARQCWPGSFRFTTAKPSDSPAGGSSS